MTANVDLQLYLADENYLPEETEVWETFRPKFLKFSVEGDKAFAVIEQCICFYTTYYAHDINTSFRKIEREHRLYRNLQYRYPEYSTTLVLSLEQMKTKCPNLRFQRY